MMSPKEHVKLFREGSRARGRMLRAFLTVGVEWSELEPTVDVCRAWRKRAVEFFMLAPRVYSFSEKDMQRWSMAELQGVGPEKGREK